MMMPSKNNIGKQQDHDKDSVNSVRIIPLMLAPIGHSTKLPRQTMTNTPTAPSRECYFEPIDETGMGNSTYQVSIDIHTLNSPMKTWKRPKDTGPMTVTQLKNLQNNPTLTKRKRPICIN